MIVVDGYVPVIDLSGALVGDAALRASLAETIDATCRESGFLVFQGHGVDPAVVERMHQASLDFFRLPAPVKEQYEAVLGDPTLRGFYHTPSYVAASEEIETAPDLCQLYTVNRLGEPGGSSTETLGEAFDVWSKPNPWPNEVPDFRDAWLAYYEALERFSNDLMQLFALALGLEETFFDDKIDEHITNLVANYYPAVTEDPLPGQYRKGPHSDWGTFTVLYQDDTGGLEVQNPDTGEWLTVPVVPGAFVVNIGDLMSVWTNGLWRSTKHRVLVPPAEARAVPRVSIPYFHTPNWRTEVECLPSCLDEGEAPKFEAVTSGAYLLAKIQSAYA